MIYPTKLKPTAFEKIEFSPDKFVEVPKATPRFVKWLGKPIEDDYNKIVLDFNGESLFAELIILRIFQDDGWEGVWVDTYRRKYRTDWINKNGIILPPDKMRILVAIYKKLGAKKGCWDIFCWKNDNIIFSESKYSKKDKLRPNQINFLKAALHIGLDKESFLLVEWSLA